MEKRRSRRTKKSRVPSPEQVLHRADFLCKNRLDETCQMDDNEKSTMEECCVRRQNERYE